MENKIYSTEEMEWFEGVRKQLHRIKVGLDILLLSFFAIIAFVFCHFCNVYDVEFALEQVLAVGLLLMPAFLIACMIVSDSLVKCYCQYRCKECGHIHRLTAEDVKKETDGLYYCENCGKRTKHKTAPMMK